jgi:hypothetical protein
MDAFTQRFGGRIEGLLAAFDQLTITGTLPDIAHPKAMARELRRRGLRLWDFPTFAEEQANGVREGVEALAAHHQVQVEQLRKGQSPAGAVIHTPPEDVTAEATLLRAFATYEPCTSFRPWRGNPGGSAELKPRDASCVHYHLQLVEPDCGLCQLRIPTLVPFPLRIELRGHRLLARRLDRQGVRYSLTDDGFQWIQDMARAQRLAGDVSPERLHRCFDALSNEWFPPAGEFPSGHHWSLARVSLATQVFFRDPGELDSIYADLIRATSEAVRSEDVARFVGRPPTSSGAVKLGVELSHRDLGSALALRRGPITIGISQRSGRILRVETSTEDVTHLRDLRGTRSPNGTTQVKSAAVRRSIYSLPAVRRLLEACNLRVLEFLGELAGNGTGARERKGEQSRQA